MSCHPKGNSECVPCKLNNEMLTLQKYVTNLKILVEFILKESKTEVGTLFSKKNQHVRL